MRLLKPESSRCVYHRRVLSLPGSLSILQRLSCTSAASFHSFAAGLSLKKSVLQFHLTSNQFNSLLQWERRRAVTLNNNQEAALRGVATCCFVLLKNLIILHNLGAHFPTDLAFYPLFYSKHGVCHPLPPLGTSICYLSGGTILPRPLVFNG